MATISGHWKFAFACLYLEARTHKNTRPDKELDSDDPALWCFERFRTVLKQGDGWPKQGFLFGVQFGDEVLKNTQAERKDGFDAMKSFFEEFITMFKNGGDRKAFADLISTENQTNPFKKGARVYQEVFNKLWAKGNVPPALDRMLSKNNFLPWHMCNAAGFAYTPGKVKGKDGAVSLTHCRELFDIMLKQKKY